MRPLQEIIDELHIQLGRPTAHPQLPLLIKEFDESCCDKKTIDLLRKDKKILEHVRIINTKIVEVYATTISSVISGALAKLNLEELKTWPNAPTFIRLTDLWNCYSLFVVNDILTIKNLEIRNRQIERWIAIARKLHKEQDFFSAEAIFKSITQREVERLYKEKEVIQGLSGDALRRLSDLHDIYNLPSKILRERYIFTAVGPKLSDICSAIKSSKANLEGSSILRGREKSNVDSTINEVFCRELMGKMYGNYEEKINSNKILASLRMEMLSYYPQACKQRELSDLTALCTNLETKLGLAKTENAKNPTTENATKLAALEKEFSMKRKDLKELTSQEEIKEKELQEKTNKLKPKNTVLSPSKLVAKVGSLIATTPSLPNLEPPLLKSAPVVKTRDRAQSIATVDPDFIPLDLHGSMIVTRERSATISNVDQRPVDVSVIDLTFFQTSRSSEKLVKSPSVRDFSAKPRVSDGRGSVREKRTKSPRR